MRDNNSVLSHYDHVLSDSIRTLCNSLLGLVVYGTYCILPNFQAASFLHFLRIGVGPHFPRIGVGPQKLGSIFFFCKARYNSLEV